MRAANIKVVENYELELVTQMEEDVARILKKGNINT